MLIMYQKYHLACICIHYHAIKLWHKRKGSEELTSDPFSVPEKNQLGWSRGWISNVIMSDENKKNSSKSFFKNKHITLFVKYVLILFEA